MNNSTEGEIMEDGKPDAYTRVSRRELLDAVSFARKFSWKGIPVLENVKLSIRGNGNLSVRATDLETDVESSIESDGSYGETPIELLIDKKKLADTLKSLNDESVTLEFFAGEDVSNVCPGCGTYEFEAPPVEGGVLTPSPVPDEAKASNWNEKTCVKCGHVGEMSNFYPPNIPAKFKVGKFFALHPGLNVGEFPEAGEFPDELKPVVSTNAGDLKKVVGAAAKYDGGFKLSVVKFSNNDDLMVATDGHRLHTVGADVRKGVAMSADTLKKLTVGKKDDEEMVFLQPPTKSLEIPEGLKKAEMIELWEKHSGEKLPASMTVADIRATMSAEPSAKNIYMDDGNRKITMRMPEANFPDYNAVTNREEKDRREIVVNVGILREGMKQALTLTTTDYMTVKMSFNGCIDLEIVVEEDSYNRTSVAVESGSVEPPVTHNFNAKYINDILNLFKDDVDLTLDVPDEHSPLFFNDNAGFEGLVMPAKRMQA